MGEGRLAGRLWSSGRAWRRMIEKMKMEDPQ